MIAKDGRVSAVFSYIRVMATELSRSSYAEIYSSGKIMGGAAMEQGTPPVMADGVYHANTTPARDAGPAKPEALLCGRRFPLIFGKYNFDAKDQAGLHDRSIAIPLRQAAYLPHRQPRQSLFELLHLHSIEPYPDRPPADRMSTIDEIKSRIDLVQLIEESGVKLRKTGRNYTGFCPFHANKNTPAFAVWPESGTWRCFGECNEGGDVFKYVMKKEGIDFREALARLARKAGVELPAYRQETPEQKEAYEHIRKLLEDALVFYAGQLRNNPAVLKYLREKRKLSDTTIETFGLGYAPAGWDIAVKHFAARGHSARNLIDAGLASERENDSSIYDRFRNRIMFPIRDENGRMAGFGARIVDPNDIPKFLNSPETPVFSKGRILYGLDRARKAIRAADQVVIVEGYLDVIALHQAGFENVVSPMGTALTEEQLRLLKRFTRRVVLALDPDTAGQKAVLRGLDAARGAMVEVSSEPDFNARGWLRQEARLQADLRVASMPDGLDPDEIAARDPEEWKRLIQEAKPIIEHVMETLAHGRDINDRRVAMEIADRVLPLIQELPKPDEREFFEQRLARFLRIDERAFIGSGGQAQRTPRQRAQREQQVVRAATDHRAPAVTLRSSQMVEHYVIGVLFRRPELLYRLDRLLQEYDLSPLSPQDFEYTDYQLLFGLIDEAVQQDQTEHHMFVVESMPESLQPLSRELLAQTEKLSSLNDKLLEELSRGVKRMREDAATRGLMQFKFLQEEAQEKGDTAAAASYMRQALELARLKRVLNEFEYKLAAKRRN